MTDIKKLFDQATAAMKNAYAPYSKFHVGSCIETESGKLYSGCNIENAAYGLTICAEACAVCAMASAGESNIKHIAVIINGPDVAMPCGACRQRIFEFATPETMIHVGNTEGATRSYRMNELLPSAFGKHNLIP